MIKQTHKPIQLTKSMLINILRGMEAKHLKSASIYDRDFRGTCISNAHSGNFSGDMVCSLPRLRPETISMVVIILSPSHPLRVRKYLVIQIRIGISIRPIRFFLGLFPI